MTISAINFGCARPQFGNALSPEAAAKRADTQFNAGRSAQAIDTLANALDAVKPDKRNQYQEQARQLLGYYEIYDMNDEAQRLAEKFGIGEQ